MGLRRLGRNDYIGSVFGGSHCDGFADASAGAGDEQGLAFQISHGFFLDPTIYLIAWIEC